MKVNFPMRSRDFFFVGWGEWDFVLHSNIKNNGFSQSSNDPRGTSSYIFVSIMNTCFFVSQRDEISHDAILKFPDWLDKDIAPLSPWSLRADM